MSDLETVFVGRITAGMTHEFMNVLATIGQTSGLMEDLLVLCRDTPFPHQEKFQKVLKIIRDQVSRGTLLGSRLKDFAHSMDDDRSRVEINEVMEQVSFLTQRFVRLKKVQLNLGTLEAPHAIHISLFRLQLILIRCIECCLDHVTAGGNITFQAEKSPGRITFQIFYDREHSTGSDPGVLSQEVADLGDILKSLEVRILPLSMTRGIGLEVVLPLSK